MTAGAILAEARGVSRDFPLPRRRVWGRVPVKHAVIDADLAIHAGQSTAIVGESGSGKSTLIRLLLGLDRPTSGSVWFDGHLVDAAREKDSRWIRRHTGIVLQDPYASLDPRWTIGAIVAEPLRALRIGGDQRAQVEAVLERVGLHSWRARQYPHELSGGQRQRVALARGIVHRPRLLVGDEPLSALDVTIRAQILDLLTSLAREDGMTVVLVSHDLGLVRHFAERVWVMHQGRIVEHGPADQVLGAPTHPYTRSLAAAVPRLPPHGMSPRAPQREDLPRGPRLAPHGIFSSAPLPDDAPGMPFVATAGTASSI
ncbi:MAG: ATP-binding cassette domain-containing protein [Bifidobacteriaceae bacterium]|jgi:peptide/nickel transport system ATP-binding protein|nr:ATP-binding cassette domain-containing protein [Bifidobacteriaceae bacterium]